MKFAETLVGLKHFSLGGSLAIFNGLCWICFAFGRLYLEGSPPGWAVSTLLPLLVFLALPIAVPCLLLRQGGSAEDVVFDAVVFGINALLWGHSIAWIIRRVGKRFGWNCAMPSSDLPHEDIAETNYYG